MYTAAERERRLHDLYNLFMGGGANTGRQQDPPSPPPASTSPRWPQPQTPKSPKSPEPPWIKTQGEWRLNKSRGKYNFDPSTGKLIVTERGKVRGRTTTSDVVTVRADVTRDDFDTHFVNKPAVSLPTLGIEVIDGNIQDEMQTPARRHDGRVRMYVLPSQLNGAEYPNQKKIVTKVSQYLTDNTGGPRGQLGADPGVAQFIIDNAANANRASRDLGIDNTRAMGNMPGIHLQNGYLQVEESARSAAAFGERLQAMELMGVRNVAVVGLDVSLKRLVEPASPTVRVVASNFLRRNQEGDFEWEIRTNREPRTLYVFNDNATDHATSLSGGGNAVIRPFNRYSHQPGPVRSAGVSTGDHGRGYSDLTPAVRARINQDVQEIRELLATGAYDCVKYSGDGSGGLGTGLFEVGEEVKQHIVASLRGLQRSGPINMVDLAYASAVPLNKDYGNIGGAHTTEVANMTLYAQYTAALRMAAQRGGCDVILMLLGGGYFTNDFDDIKRAIAAAYTTTKVLLDEADVRVFALAWEHKPDEGARLRAGPAAAPEYYYKVHEFMAGDVTYYKSPLLYDEWVTAMQVDGDLHDYDEVEQITSEEYLEYLTIDCRSPEVQNDYELVGELLRDKGKGLHQVKGDGNCMYYAISHQLHYRRIAAYLAIDLRQLAWKEFDKLAEEHDDDLLKEEYRNHAVSVLQEGSYGGHQELVALSRALKVQFCVYQLQQKSRGKPTGNVEDDCVIGTQMIPEENNGEPVVHLYLKFMGGDNIGNHYDSVVETGYVQKACKLCDGRRQGCTGLVLSPETRYRPRPPPSLETMRRSDMVRELDPKQLMQLVLELYSERGVCNVLKTASVPRLVLYTPWYREHQRRVQTAMTSPGDTCPLVDFYAAACEEKLGRAFPHGCTAAAGRIAPIRNKVELKDYMSKYVTGQDTCEEGHTVCPVGLMGTLSSTEPPGDIYPRWGGHCIYLVYHRHTGHMCVCDRNITTADEAAIEEYIPDFLKRGVQVDQFEGFRLPGNHPAKYEVPPELLPYFNAMSVFEPAIMDNEMAFVTALSDMELLCDLMMTDEEPEPMETKEEEEEEESPPEPRPRPSALTEDGQLYGPARAPPPRNDYLRGKKTTRSHNTVADIRAHLHTMQKIVDEKAHGTTTMSTSGPDKRFVDYIHDLEEVCLGGANYHRPHLTRNLYVLIAQAVMKHYGDCDVCVTQASDSELMLFAPKYFDRDQPASDVLETIEGPTPKGRRVGWLRSECELRALYYGQLNIDDLPHRVGDEREWYKKFVKGLKQNPYHRHAVDIRTPQDLTYYIETEYLPRCDPNARIALIGLHLRGDCAPFDKMWAGHQNQIVFDLQEKTICLNDPNVSCNNLREFEYISDYIGEQLADFIEKKKEDGENYTYMGYCLASVLEGEHAGTCRYADQMALFDQRLQSDAKYYMQRLVWVMKTMVNMTNEIDTDGNRPDGVAPPDVAPFEDWEREAMECPQNRPRAYYSSSTMAAADFHALADLLSPRNMAASVLEPQQAVEPEQQAKTPPKKAKKKKKPIDFEQLEANAPEDKGRRLGEAARRLELMAKMRAEKKKMKKWRETLLGNDY